MSRTLASASMPGGGTLARHFNLTVPPRSINRLGGEVRGEQHRERVSLRWTSIPFKEE